ncbi:MAG: hypothetical protein CMJ35_03550 [Phycisphaerae bacterium]|nr:hypothetical protein [Phycisphaerae bacterium]MBM90674.1 hypothetical protein [Phycisphaerae bacterium]|tara:strand:+ start:235 stop:606 length:372 start_codon:yes stop_codon:yes gene_type:complete
MSNTNIKSVRVIRYSPDGGYAAIEWLRAFQSVEIPHAISDGDTWRIGVQITKKRVIDVILRIEKLDGFTDLLRARLGRTHSDQLYKHPKRCAQLIPGSGRPLALLSAKHLGDPVRILVCATAN